MDNAQSLRLINNNFINNNCKPTIRNVSVDSFSVMADERNLKCSDSIRPVLVSNATEFQSSESFFKDNATQTSFKWAPKEYSMQPSAGGHSNHLSTVSVVNSIEHMPHEIDLKSVKSSFIVIGDNVAAQRHCCLDNNSLCHYGSNITNLGARRSRAYTKILRTEHTKLLND